METTVKYPGEPSMHELGRVLTSLGFTDRKRTNVGYILWLDLRTRKRIHQLAHEHGIDREAWFAEKGFNADCSLCKEMAGANSSSNGLNQDGRAKRSQK